MKKNPSLSRDNFRHDNSGPESVLKTADKQIMECKV